MTDFDVAARGASTTNPATPGTTDNTVASTRVEDGIASAKTAATPYVEKARGFAKARPWTAAALVGVVGLAVLNTLRGK